MIKSIGIIVLIVGLAAVCYSDDNFNRDALTVHNAYRKRHCVLPLQLDVKLNKIAQDYANKLINKKIAKHSKDEYGENIFVSSRYPSGNQATRMWYGESNKYNYLNPNFSADTGHFTQVVWANSKYVGFGVAKAANGRVYVVAKYYPPGNYVNEFASNVKKPGC